MSVPGTFRDRTLRQAAKTVTDYLDDEGRELVWGSMIYACGYGHEERYYLGVGVEGPRDFRERGAYIPCPFIAGSCPQCGLPMKHKRWNEDENFDDLRPVPDGARYFRIPGEKLAAEFLRDAAYGGAELVDPHPWSGEA